MNSTSEQKSKKMKGAMWTARILSSLTTALWGFWFIGSLASNYLDEESEFSLSGGALAVSLFFIIILAGTIIGWWNEKWGGIILTAGYFLNAIGGYILAVTSHGSAGYIVGFFPVILFLPLLIAGYLYIAYWKKNRKIRQKLLVK